MSLSRMHAAPVARNRAAMHIRATPRSMARGKRFNVQCAQASSGDDSGASSSGGAAAKFGWSMQDQTSDPRVKEIPLSAIRRPLMYTKTNDQEKVAALMESIKEVGQKTPIDVLDVDGVYYGFNGCHRYEAHQKLGLPTIKCRVRKATQQTLRMHLM